MSPPLSLPELRRSGLNSPRKLWNHIWLFSSVGVSTVCSSWTAPCWQEVTVLLHTWNTAAETHANTHTHTHVHTVIHKHAVNLPPLFPPYWQLSSIQNTHPTCQGLNLVQTETHRFRTHKCVCVSFFYNSEAFFCFWRHFFCHFLFNTSFTSKCFEVLDTWVASLVGLCCGAPLWFKIKYLN